MSKNTQQIFSMLFKAFSECGKDIRMCGGAVRDILSNKEPKDLDFCTDATPDFMIEIGKYAGWKVLPTGIEHGTVTFVTEHGNFEVTTLRKDVETDGRHAKVEFTNDWKADAARRDFTINAMMMDVAGNVFDWFNGQEDLKNHVVRFVGDADERINEDALRMMRAVRFSARTEHDNMETMVAVARNADKIKNISTERVWQEFNSAFKHNFYKFLVDMANTGLAHKLDINMVITPFKAASMPFTMGCMMPHTDAEKHANDFADKFKLSNEERKEMVFAAVHKSPKLDMASVGKHMANGVSRQWMIDLARFQGNDALVEWCKIAPQHFFPVKGQDLLDAGMKPGPAVGDALRKLRQEWEQSNFEMNKEQLMKMV